MKEKFNDNDVPQNYAHCLNAQCSCAADCLRFQVGSYALNDVSHFTIVNPTYNAEKGCPFFQIKHTIRFASGITHLYDELTHEKYRKIKKSVYNYFGHSQYYRIYNKKRLIEPDDQAFIRNLFAREGIANEPLFDEYIERYDFFSRS